MQRKSSPRKGSKSSPETRPRRRASQTYFIKYQLARNPLKAEEEDLKLALLASLQQCNTNNSNHNSNGSDSRASQNGNTNNNDHNKGSNGISAGYKRLTNATKKHARKPHLPKPTLNHHQSASDHNKNPTRRKNGVTKLVVTPVRKTKPNSQEECSNHSIGNKNNVNNQSNDHTASQPTTTNSKASHQIITATYSPYAPLQKKEPPNEDYLKKYKPETEDFLTFICFRTTAPNYNHPQASIDKGAGNRLAGEESHSYAKMNINPMIGNHCKIADSKQVPNNHKHRSSSSSSSSSTPTSPYKSIIHNNGTDVTDLANQNSPNNRRRPIRQSPRLATRQSKQFAGSNAKISENEFSMGCSMTAYDNSSINYEENLKRASIALEDMAQEINSSDNIKDEGAQNSNDCVTAKSSTSLPLFKNNKHLVKGLMTREFAGAFADEDTIFESISNHKL